MRLRDPELMTAGQFTHCKQIRHSGPDMLFAWLQARADKLLCTQRRSAHRSGRRRHLLRRLRRRYRRPCSQTCRPCCRVSPGQISRRIPPCKSRLEAGEKLLERMPKCNMTGARCSIQTPYRAILRRQIQACSSASPSIWQSSTVVIRRHLGDQKREFLGYVDSHEKLLAEVGIAIGVGKYDVDDVTRTAQSGRLHVYAAQ